MRAVPATVDFAYSYTIGHNVATVLAAFGTFFFTNYFSSTPKSSGTDGKAALQGEELSEKPSSDVPTLFHHKDSSCTAVHELNRKILHHLCLGIDVDACWSGLSEDVRDFILCRILGKPAHMTLKVATWLSSESKNTLEHDESLLACVEWYADQSQGREYDNTQTREGQSVLPELTSAYSRKPPAHSFLRSISRSIVHSLDVVVKWTALISGAASDTNRELWYAMRDNHARPILLWVLLKAWKLCWWTKNFWTYVLLMAGKAPLARLLSLIRHGAPRTLRANSILVDTPTYQLSGFMVRDEMADLRIMIYEGLHPQAPKGKVKAIAFYDCNHRLHRREVFSSPGASPSVTIYGYEDRSKRWPISKSTLR